MRNTIEMFARNFFGVENSLSFHIHKGKNNFSVLGEGPTIGIDDSTGAEEKNLVLTLVNQIQICA